jgi:hypothetical protein
MMDDNRLRELLMTASETLDEDDLERVGRELLRGGYLPEPPSSWSFDGQWSGPRLRKRSRQEIERLIKHLSYEVKALDLRKAFDRSRDIFLCLCKAMHQAEAEEGEYGVGVSETHLVAGLRLFDDGVDLTEGPGSLVAARGGVLYRILDRAIADLRWIQEKKERCWDGRFHQSYEVRASRIAERNEITRGQRVENAVADLAVALLGGSPVLDRAEGREEPDPNEPRLQQLGELLSKPEGLDEEERDLAQRLIEALGLTEEDLTQELSL